MPEVIIRDMVIDRLKEIQFNPDLLLKKKSVSYLFGNYIKTMDEDIVVLDDNLFESTINTHDFNEILYTETLYETNRISRQLDSVLALLKAPSSPRAWLLITVYYHAFFCANLITRLLGRYSCYFSADDIRWIKTYAENKTKKGLTHGNYVGYYISGGDEGIKIRFKHEGDRPHYTAWKNLHDKVRLYPNMNSSDTVRYNRIRLFKYIIKENSGSWPLPSEIRNKWNYTDSFLYTKKGDEVAKEFSTLLGNSGDIKWAARKNIYPNDENVATSMAFISSTLKRCIDACKPKILR